MMPSVVKPSAQKIFEFMALGVPVIARIRGLTAFYFNDLLVKSSGWGTKKPRRRMSP